MEQILQLLVQQQAAAAERTKQQGAHIAGLLQLQVQATEQEIGSRNVLPMRQHKIFRLEFSIKPSYAMQDTKKQLNIRYRGILQALHRNHFPCGETTKSNIVSMQGNKLLAVLKSLTISGRLESKVKDKTDSSS
ncbi:hypothetical protein Y1Q_0000573 [Alligator mississippiensis]|uniref:Uncharacterized protein n=1 Tax=Alligator mississippiensis TaxID=8496 RepID=A0A151MBK8_ALLMI|nr:hypothetical protein Y1Q_0000573 [Alligator mississippiensis]